MEEKKESRRSVIKKMVYVVPVVLTLTATAAFARNGSADPGPPCPECS